MPLEPERWILGALLRFLVVLRARCAFACAHVLTLTRWKRTDSAHYPGIFRGSGITVGTCPLLFTLLQCDADSKHTEYESGKGATRPRYLPMVVGGPAGSGVVVCLNYRDHRNLHQHQV